MLLDSWVGQVGATMNKTAKSTLVQASLWTDVFISLEWIPRCELHGKWMCNLLRNCQPFPQFTILHFYQECRQVCGVHSRLVVIVFRALAVLVAMKYSLSVLTCPFLLTDLWTLFSVSIHCGAGLLCVFNWCFQFVVLFTIWWSDICIDHFLTFGDLCFYFTNNVFNE